ncbi:hypothetical protein ABK040_015520 [Willaertia magna]
MKRKLQAMIDKKKNKNKKEEVHAACSSLDDSATINLTINDHINQQYSSEEGIKQCAETYKTNKPFPYLHLKNFFQDKSFLEEVKVETLSLKYWEKDNDLYHFLQTKDLQKNKAVEENQHLCLLRNVLYSPSFREWMEKVTGLTERNIKLNNNVDMFVSCYRDTHHLLCHDDELDNRRIAYIIYLVPEDWNNEDGGHLDLFEVDNARLDQPVKVGASVVPSFNSISFFEVSPVSYHQVREVLRSVEQEDDRIAVTGWLYSDIPVDRPTHTINDISPLEYKEPNSDNSSVDLKKWLNDSYLKTKTIDAVNQSFCDESSIELRSFLKEEVFNKLYKELQELNDDQFELAVPVNRRQYLKVNVDKVDKNSLVYKFDQVLNSKTFIDTLTKMTSCTITKINVQARKFRKGDYALVQNTPTDETRLDVILRLCPTEWEFEYGGGIVYMDEVEELLSVLPEPNTISMVLRDKGVQTFVKYLNHHAPGDIYDYLITCETEVEEGDDEEEGEWEDVE